MDDDWDLYAVVRSCTNAGASSTASSSTVTDANTISQSDNSNRDYLESFQRSGDNSSLFPGFVNHMADDSFPGLEEIYKEVYENTQPYDNNSLPQHNPTTPSNSAPQAVQNPLMYSDSTPQQQIYMQPQQVIQSQQYSNLRHGFFGSTLSFPSTNPQPIRPRRRKNQQPKMIHQMTQEQLSADTWAWRKYGQKPIKGSPYPRNYYRCSTSKGCLARKQVERCPTDPNLYVVSYSGEHSHPRPTHRSSLAGSTRNKVSPAAKPASAANIASSVASCSSSSPASASSFSPTTLITEADSAAEENADEQGADTLNNEIGIFSGEEEEDRWDDDDDDDDDDGNDILIPNTLVTDDIIKGLQFKN